MMAEADAGKPPFRNLPNRAPLSMPVQSLKAKADRHGRPRVPVTESAWMFLRRLLVLGSAMLLTAYGAYKVNLVFNSLGVSVLGIVMMVLFVMMFLWIALAFTSSVAGFVELLRRGGLSLGVEREGPLPQLRDKTAILMPTYNEDPARVLAGLRAIYRSLERTGQLGKFDFFILSDTTRPDVWLEEERAFLAFRQEMDKGEQHIFYRRRAKNIERKSGNIAEWVQNFGGAYPYMLTLDADSVMSGETIVRIVAAMEEHPDVGLVQTLPVIVNGGTLFARMQQFAGRMYGPMIAYGVAWWYGSESNYWGHNAVIRTRAFAEQAGLPHLRGRRPIGGAIMSHDFVEAALMRRGGWAIHMVPGLPGSYEESPPSLTDIAIRDRRWCQGNLQHAGVLAARGLHWLSRLHMVMGIGAYVMSPVWLLSFLVGILISLQSTFVKPEYFSTARSLYPHWPQVDPVQARDAFILTMAILLAPKFLAYIATMCNPVERERFGGWLRSLYSVLLETVIGGLIASIAMLIQTSAVISILRGADSGWNAQRRDDGGYPLSQIVSSYWVHTAFGVVFGLAAWSVSFSLFLWMTPVLLGLILAIPLVHITGSRRAGDAFRRAGLLLIPEEVQVPSVLREAREQAGPSAQDQPSCKELLLELFASEEHLSAHKAMLPPERKPGEPIDAHLLVALVKLKEALSLDELLSRLDDRELTALLAHPEGVEGLRKLALRPVV